ncbi:MAG: ATP phosphoribosyltransferase [Planctomycetota bacterium]
MSNPDSTTSPLRLVVPKGRIQDRVVDLLGSIGCRVRFSTGRSYRPQCSNKSVSVKLLKPRNVPELLELGRHDCGFTGHDWVVEYQSDVVEVLDLGYDPVQIVAAIPEDSEIVRDDARPMVVATEYVGIATRWAAEQRIPARMIRTFGATEVFPPEDADMIVDNTSTGETLRANHLKIIGTLLASSTRFVASREAMADPTRRARIGELATLMESVLAARRKVLLEMNVPKDRFDVIVQGLPCMRSPTVSPLWGEQGYAVKIAVDRDDVPALMIKLRAMGATDILEYELAKMMP